MPRIERSHTSVSDYEEIWRYIARDNPAAADRLITAIERQLPVSPPCPVLAGRNRNWRQTYGAFL